MTERSFTVTIKSDVVQVVATDRAAMWAFPSADPAHDPGWYLDGEMYETPGEVAGVMIDVIARMEPG